MIFDLHAATCHLLVFLERNLELLAHRLIHENFLPQLKLVSFQIAHNCLRVNYSHVLAKRIVASEHVRKDLVIVIDGPRLILARHDDILVWVRLDLAFELLREVVDDISDLLAVFHGHGVSYIFSEHSVALNEEKTFILCLKLLSLFLRLHVLLIHRSILTLLATLLLEILVDDKGEARELANWLINAPGAHIVIGRMLALVIVDEVETIALGRIGKFERTL